MITDASNDCFLVCLYLGRGKETSERRGDLEHRDAPAVSDLELRGSGNWAWQEGGGERLG